MITKTKVLVAVQISLFSTFLSIASARQDDDSAVDRNPVADDVLFLVLGKMSLYDQDDVGELSLRNHHFVAEIMPKSGRTIVSGELQSAADATQVIAFKPEGNPFLAHGARVLDPARLHELHPDGEYLFSYETQSGRMHEQPLRLEKRAAVDQMPYGASVTASQNGSAIDGSTINAADDLALGWEQMAGNTRMAASELDDLIFVLGFDCFGNNVVHSGRPYQGGPYLTYRDSSYVVPASALNPGLRYTFIVEQATADVTTFQGVPGIATYATLTFLKFETEGVPAGDPCPAP